MLIPDEAWGKDEPFETTPDSTLSELLQDGMKSTILYERAMARPFILKEKITTEDLKKARQKFVHFTTQTLVFNEDNIGNVFITKEFKDKYNSQSNKPWWTWTFSELIEQEKKHVQNKSELEVVIKNYYQEGWFKNFIANPKLKNSKLEDFFPKENEGIVHVVGSYNALISSNEVKLKEEAGFYYAGEQRDDLNMTKNINYVVQLEVKNKIFSSGLNNFNIANKNHNNEIISYSKYKDLIKSFTDNLPKYFNISSDRFAKGQIKDPSIKYVDSQNSTEFEKEGLGKIIINYQKSLPIVSQVGNEVVYKNFPLNLNNIIGMKEFIQRYKKYVMEDENQYNKLDSSQQENKILIDNIENQIIIGGGVFAQEQNFKVVGSNNKNFIVIPEEYLDPNVSLFGFDQQTKKQMSLNEFKNIWQSYNQDQLFDKLFGKYNHNNNSQKLKDLIKRRKITLKVVIENNLFKVFYDYPDAENPDQLWQDNLVGVLNLKEIKGVKLNAHKELVYGYSQKNDQETNFNDLITLIKNPKELANFFNFDNELEYNNFISGINLVEIKEENEKDQIVKIKLTLKPNFITYNANDSLEFSFSTKKMIKMTFDNLSLDNIDKKIKQEIVKYEKDEEILNYLNSLDLDIKKSFFYKNKVENFTLLDSNNNSESDLAQSFDKISNIVFSFDNKDLNASIEFKEDNLLLSAKTNTKLENFIYNLKVDLGLINPFKNSLVPWLVGGLTSAGILIMSILGFIFIRRRKQKQKYQLSDTNKNKYEFNPNDIELDN